MNNNDLGFHESVKRELQFLIEKYHFLLIEESNYKFIFNNNIIELKILFDRFRSYEIEVILSLLKQNVEYTINDLIEAKFGNCEKIPEFFQASTFERVTKNIKIIGELLNQEIKEVFNNENKFKKLSKKVDAKYEKLNKANIHKQLRKFAKIAWHEKNYLELVKLYKELGNNLTKLEKKRFKYAQVHS